MLKTPLPVITPTKPPSPIKSIVNIKPANEDREKTKEGVTVTKDESPSKENGKISDESCLILNVPASIKTVIVIKGKKKIRVEI